MLKKPEEYGYVVSNNICLFQKGPLSQWYGAFKGQNSNFKPKGFPFTEDEHTFNCCEQWMMACKAAMMEDKETLEKILKTKSPQKQKELGRKVKNYKPEIWDAHKEDVVYYGNLWKFSQNEELKEFLCSFPRSMIFAEAAPWDPIWGIGLGPENPDALHIHKWRGSNLLGIALTRVRNEIAR